MTDPYTPPVDQYETDPIGQESSLSNWAGPYVTDMLGRGAALADQPYYAYEGPLTAPISSLQDQAFSGIAGLSVPSGIGEAADAAGEIGAGLGDLNSNLEGIGETFAGIGDKAAGLAYDPSIFSTNMFTDEGVAESYMNPFIEQVLTPELAEMRRQAEISRLNDAARLTRAGSYGGSRQAIMESELTDNMLRLMAERTGTGYRDAYNKAADIFASDMDRQLRADTYSEDSKQFGARYGLDALRAEMDAARGGLDTVRAGMDNARTGLEAARAQGQLSEDEFNAALRLLGDQLNFGNAERGIYNEGIAADRKQFEEERMWPYKQVQFMQSLLDGMPLAAQEKVYPDTSWLSQFGLGAGGIMDIFDQITGGNNDGGNDGSLVDDIIDGVSDIDWSVLG